jgi:hypothetical protein
LSSRTIIRTTERGCRTRRLLAGRVGEFADQVFVGGAQQVGKLEVFIAQAVNAEVGDELAQLDVRDLVLADFAGEVDVLQHVVELVLALSMPTSALLRLSPTLWWTSLSRKR